MKSEHIEKLKFAGGAIIVAAAAFIMFPGFVMFAAGLGRILLVIVIAGGACLALAYATQYLRKQGKENSSGIGAATTSASSTGATSAGVNNFPVTADRSTETNTL